MKQILKGYVSLFREALGLPNDGSFLVPPANLLLILAVCGLIGLTRNALSAWLHVLPGFYSFQADILWTMCVFPAYLFLFGGALMHALLRVLGRRDIPVESLFGLSFYLQILHLVIPFLDWFGNRLGMPWSYIIGSQPVRTEWYTNDLVMTPGIIAAWWVTAFVTAKVLKKRLNISWPALLIAGVTTYVLILIPTYILFPTLNNLFSRTLGPYLWNPLDYLFVYPKWYPFWGYGWYFAISAVLGFIYYVRNSSVEQTRHFFSTTTAGRAHAWLLGFSVARSLLDYVWVPEFTEWQYQVLVLFNYTVYLYTIYLFIPAVAGLILERIFSKRVDKDAVLRQSVLIWFVYPVVTIINMLAHSPTRQTIEWFRFIPTFMVHNNYLPAGFIAVVPVLIFFFGWLMTLHSGANWPKALAAVLVSLWIVYLLYYQYALSLFFYAQYYHGPLVAFGTYTLSFLVVLVPLAKRFHSAFGQKSLLLPRLAVVAATICIGLIAFGLL